MPVTRSNLSSKRPIAAQHQLAVIAWCSAALGLADERVWATVADAVAGLQGQRGLLAITTTRLAWALDTAANDLQVPIRQSTLVAAMRVLAQRGEHMTRVKRMDAPAAAVIAIAAARVPLPPLTLQRLADAMLSAFPGACPLSPADASAVRVAYMSAGQASEPLVAWLQTAHGDYGAGIGDRRLHMDDTTGLVYDLWSTSPDNASQ